MIGLGEAVLDRVFPTDTGKDMLKRIAIPFPIGELDAVVGQDCMDMVGHGSDQIP
jgi:hypothetical protein